MFYAGDLGQNNKRKERADTDAGEQTEEICGFDSVHQKKPKFIHADDLQNETLEAVPNMGELLFYLFFFLQLISTNV